MDRPRSARFINENLELLGFRNPKDALVQATKELFENGERETRVFVDFSSSFCSCLFIECGVLEERKDDWS